ncbi:RING finger protein 212B isoform X2 [Erinaceus europaeus]|uniref:RING finger protein 212B isoform X2 n=1 Tax=Erinaceus europaeus TaxID=9365 RepID=A0ABM3W421_ERIEU|nr:RING finger protein 212B isoform X2 [Erinaceus europaeus]
MYFKNPVEMAVQYFNHVSQVWSFQKKQTDLLLAFYKHRISKLEAAMQEAQKRFTSQEKELSALRKENEELKKFITILKESPNRNQGNRVATPRPVGITSPSQSVTPRPSSQQSSQVVRVTGLGSLGQGTRGLQGRSTPRDSYTETPSPVSTHSLSYRPSFASSGQGIFPFRSSLNHEDSNQTRLLVPNHADSLPTQAIGISSGERHMAHFQIDDVQSLIKTCAEDWRIATKTSERRWPWETNPSCFLISLRSYGI